MRCSSQHATSVTPGVKCYSYCYHCTIADKKRAERYKNKNCAEDLILAMQVCYTPTATILETETADWKQKI